MERQNSPTAHLARLGFREPRKIAEMLARSELLVPMSAEDGNDLLRALARTADPDLAVLGAITVLESAAEDAQVYVELLETLRSPGMPRDRLLGVLGFSGALAQHLTRHPAHWRYAAYAGLPTPQECTDRLVAAVSVENRGERTAYDALRVAYQDQMLAIAAHDVICPEPGEILPSIAAALADLASAALEAALDVARQEHPEAADVRLAVIGMGKCGGRELNYISDVDVIFVAEPGAGMSEEYALSAATVLASTLMRACSSSTAEGSLWQVDAALRPEGKQGPLVRTLASHVRYYRQWAKTWEFQALLKARPVAGDPDLGRAYMGALSPLVWEAAGRPHFVDDVQAMRRRVERHVPAAEARRQLKLGPGGLRDIEFCVQLLQLVHGRADESLRLSGTLAALAALSAGGYVGREDAARLDSAYRFLRSLEHRVQVHRMRRTHLMPTGEVDLRRLGRSMGMRADPVRDVTTAWQEETREVRRIHEKLFYRPLLAAAARLSSDDVRLTPEAANERLKALGFGDPAGAMRHLQALTQGVSRTAAIHRQLLPVMLGWFADEADPDAGLLAYRRVSESLGATPWYAKMLRDSGEAAERLAHVLARSRFAGDLLVRIPEAVRLLGEPEGLLPRRRESLVSTMRSAMARKDDAAGAVEAARVIRRLELFRIAAADLSGIVDGDAAGEALTELTEAFLEATLGAVVHWWGEEPGRPFPADVAVIGMGRLGGYEMGYGSDADVLFVHRAHQGVLEQAACDAVSAVVVELRRMLALPGPDPSLEIDGDLRPEGKSGPLSRTLDGYEGYYSRWAQPWEFHALLRARVVAGDCALGEEFMALVDPLRYRPEGLSGSALRDIRRLKARMESERLPRGADPRTHVKLGPGGLSDVEWTVQFLQLAHAGGSPGLRTTRTKEALSAEAEAGLLSVGDAEVLGQAWTAASRMRDANLLWRGRASDVIPTDVRDCEGVSRILGRDADRGFSLRDDHVRTARRARSVTERVFYGRDDS
ncbi:glutamate-ammonia-ligase adenylyltransferase [Austwickia chelonae]|uniref:Bifunctional glutamine synthetase adenylyltransferase/adenylyl-removing enzyme n=1 Tax=Austwickia chelonae NBRC 105200 TaxID=1184607 RepID=K6W612_9MICO|nr:bifunctional [glutamine synthetase] adenylyltransferase/[glutamine synthetase]-adenylyl-L-tyrosine phosphorylase [Austwickia chelonae]GAB77267.1 glutamate-ammonia-ligase adenylyltransferase [Austwickia chelonae NBRC 105200]SEW06553.1 glutamate-ammonia-ligase adenylyltransferase [Austwickia chelonae]